MGMRRLAQGGVRGISFGISSGRSLVVYRLIDLILRSSSPQYNRDIDVQAGLPVHPDSHTLDLLVSRCCIYNAC